MKSHRPMRSIPLLILPLLLICGCAERGNFNQGSAYNPGLPSGIAGVDSKIERIPRLSDEAIEKALQYKADFSGYHKIAFIPTGNFGSELIGYQQELIANYDKSGKVKITRIPTIFLNGDLNLDGLRQIAARMQVDGVVLFSLNETSRHNHSFVTDDTYKSSITLDYYLIDTKSGMIPYASSVDESFEIAKFSINSDKQEEVRRAAMIACITKMSADLVATIK